MFLKSHLPIPCRDSIWRLMVFNRISRLCRKLLPIPPLKKLPSLAELWVVIIDILYFLIYGRDIKSRQSLWVLIIDILYFLVYGRDVESRQSLWVVIIDILYFLIYGRDVESRPSLWVVIIDILYIFSYLWSWCRIPPGFKVLDAYSKMQKRQYAFMYVDQWNAQIILLKQPAKNWRFFQICHVHLYVLAKTEIRKT
jgi:hypothetical protein